MVYVILFYERGTNLHNKLGIIGPTALTWLNQQSAWHVDLTQLQYKAKMVSNAPRKVKDGDLIARASIRTGHTSHLHTNTSPARQRIEFKGIRVRERKDGYMRQGAQKWGSLR